MIIKQIYLDLDGVLVNFIDAAVDASLLDIKSGKVDWNALHAMGTIFWENLEWLEEGRKLYDFLLGFTKEHDIDLCILTAVGLTSGKEGKLNWIKKQGIKINPLNVYIVNRGSDKKTFADHESLLIDDYGKNVNEFIQAGGEAIKFKKNTTEVINKIKELVSKG